MLAFFRAILVCRIHLDVIAFESCENGTRSSHGIIATSNQITCVRMWRALTIAMLPPSFGFLPVTLLGYASLQLFLSAAGVEKVLAVMFILVLIATIGSLAIFAVRLADLNSACKCRTGNEIRTAGFRLTPPDYVIDIMLFAFALSPIFIRSLLWLGNGGEHIRNSVLMWQLIGNGIALNTCIAIFLVLVLVLSLRCPPVQVSSLNQSVSQRHLAPRSVQGFQSSALSACYLLSFGKISQPERARSRKRPEGDWILDHWLIPVMRSSRYYLLRLRFLEQGGVRHYLLYAAAITGIALICGVLQ